MSHRKMNFCNRFGAKPFRATVANANIGCQKLILTLFDTYLDYMPVKFEQKPYGQKFTKF